MLDAIIVDCLPSAVGQTSHNDDDLTIFVIYHDVTRLRLCRTIIMYLDDVSAVRLLILTTLTGLLESNFVRPNFLNNEEDDVSRCPLVHHTG